MTGRDRCSVEPVQPLQKQQRRLIRATLLDGAREQFPRGLEVAGLIRRHTGVQQLLGLSLTLRQRPSSAFDVRARTPVASLEKRDARPDVDGLLVVAAEIVIESGE